MVGYHDDNANSSPIRSYQANELSPYDINGNIWEWCSDWYDYYTSELSKNPKGLKYGIYKVGRGASIDSDPWHTQKASRIYVKSKFTRPGGIRLVRDIK